jgi:hypothetical protein
MFARGQALPPIGSVEDRVMREMVLRERSERVAHVRAIAAIAARAVGMDADKLFGDVVAEYASEVFQEAYDPAALARKARRLREAQVRIQRRRAQDAEMVRRLDRMEALGKDFDRKKGREFDNDSKPVDPSLRSRRG